jgi:hypothetical protein
MIEQASLVIGNCNWANKEGSLLGYKLIDGKYYAREIDAVRATTATRVNSAGLVELVPYNLLQYSEQFDNGAWIKITTTLTSGQSDPFGGNNAYKWNSSAIGVTQLSQSFSTGADVCNISIYAKAGSTSILNIWIGSAVTFDLANGSVTSGTGTITSVGNGWYRCSTNRSSISLTNTLNPYFSAASTSDFIYIYGGQAVEGSDAKPYQKTETRLNIPRLDYSNGTCPSLLVEPQRTNLALYSSSFDNAAWTLLNGTITANNTTAPDGTLTADKFTLDAGTNQKVIFQVVSLNGTYSLSWFMKKGTHRYTQLLIGSEPDIYANFDLQDGVLGSYANCTPKIEDYGNGWYRCTMSFTTGFGSAIDIFAIDSASAARAAATSSTGDFYVWGAQLEVGSYPTSYIPTTSASVTRNADAISKTGISSLIGQTEGVIFIDYYASAQNQDGVSYAFLFLGGNSTNNILIYNSGTALQWFIQSTSGIIVNENANQTIVAGTRYKIAVAYKAGDYALYINGVQKRTSTNASAPPMMSQFNLNGEDYGVNAAKVKNEFNAVAFWPTRLTNTQLAQLTTI